MSLYSSDPIPDEDVTAESYQRLMARYDRLMECQQKISLMKNQALVGKTLDVLVEGHGVGEDEDGNELETALSIGRSYRDAPEIDGYVIIEGELPIGEITPVRITGATAYDLFAMPI